MAQATTKVIDISRSYVPMDPNGFPESMHATGGEDNPEQRVPVIPYAGYNFMPTGYGYMSYFGIGQLFQKPLLGLTTPFDPLNADDLFIVQTPSLSNIFVALCEDGIYTKVGSNDDNWEKVISLTVPDAGEHLNYTRVVIGNEVYIYRATEANVWVMRAAENFVPTALSPTHLNMAAQQGIYRAGARLGFWDSANSTAWSNPDDKEDLVPDLQTGAGAAIFQQVVGKIVNVLAHGNGFIIYATRSIVYCQRTTDNNFLFAASTVFDGNGISYLQEACAGQPDTMHFAYTTFGIVKIEGGKAEYIIPEVFSYLKESRDPVYPKILEGRYLFLQVLNPDYITGIPNFSVEDVPGTTITFKGASYAVENVSQNPCKALRAAEQNESRYLFDTYGFTRNTQAEDPASVPIWSDYLAHNISLAIMELYKASGVSGMGSVSFFDDQAFNNGNIAKIDGSGNESFLPTAAACPGLLADYLGTPTLPLQTIEANSKNFFMKQDFLWLYEQNFFTDWKEGIRRRAHTPIETSGAIAYSGPAQATGYASTVRTLYTFGPFINLDFFSEANKYYGVAEKSAWLQRSLVKAVTVKVEEVVLSVYGASTEADWDVGGVVDGLTYAEVTDATTVSAYLNTHNPLGSATYVATTIASDVAGCANTGAGPTYREVIWNITVDGTPTTIAFAPQPQRIATIGNPDDIFASGVGMYVTTADRKQVFNQPEFIYSDLDTCVYKNLGYTRITGHGHYELDGSFVVDDSTPEAADYVDQCDVPPEKDRKTKFNGIQIPNGIGYGCLPGPVTIDEEVYSYPDQVIVLPPSSFLLQDGSIEPVYPTFAGAYVYDLQLKKWGKDGQPHKLLLNYSPVNSQAGDKPVPTDIFSVNAGALLEDGNIALFDKYPTEGFITWGKVGYYRHGFTDCHSIDLQFRNLATGSVTLEGSLDGKNINPAISQIVTYEDVNQVRAGFSSSARWFNVTVDGIYDIKNIDFNGNRHGKR